MSWETYNSFESSNIAEIRYDDSSLTLEVSFHNGGVYQYFDVPSHIWESFKTAESQGKFLHQSIKGTYRYSKV